MPGFKSQHHYCCKYILPIQKMENLHKLNIEELVDILSTQTTLYLQMQVEGTSQIEFQRCWLLVHAVQAEIKSRREKQSKKLQGNTGNSCPN